jgi:polysaccharide biosynthesis transport protein
MMKQLTDLSMPRNHQGIDDEIDLAKLFLTLWRGKFWILLSGVLALFAGGYYAFDVAVPLYTANTTVALESRDQQVMDIESVVTGLGGDQSTINTEVEVIRSRRLIEQLVLDMDLLADPEFNAQLRPVPVFSVGQAVSLVRGVIKGPAEPPVVASERAILDQAIDAVTGAIGVSNIRQSFVFRITVITQKAEKSAAIANRLADLYINDQITVKFQKTEQATLWLSERVSGLQAQLETAESELKEFSSNTNLINSDSLQALNRQIKDLRERRGTMTAIANAAQDRFENLQSLRSANAEDLAQAANDASLTQFLARIKDGRAGGQQAFDARVDALMTRAELEAARAKAQLTALETSITEVRTRIETQSGELVALEQLQREVEANRLLYEAFLGRLKETSIQQGIQQADSRVLSQAVVPRSASAPRKPLILALSLMLGLIGATGAILIREMSQNTFRVSEDLEARTGYNVIGQIPAIPARRRKNVLKYLVEKPNSAAAEAIRNLRTSMLLANLDKPPKVIMSTSSIPGEGKTTQSIALTQNLSGMGAKVLLLEGDIRRRIFSQYFNQPNQKGFLSVLSGEVALEDALVHDESLNADILFGEKSPINAADLFSSSKFAGFLKMLSEKYDYIIIDTPPVLAVPDARVIGQSVDAILYTVKWDSTSHRQVLDGIKSFESVNLKISGLVLSQIDKRGMKRYGYGNSYGDYQNYYDN